MEGLFDSAWLKWGWATKESELLKQELRAFADDPRFQDLNAAACHYHPKRHGFVLTVERMAPIPPWIVLRIGTVAHNYRSALDNLAWAFVRRGRTPPETLTKHQRKAISFPVTYGRDEFKSALFASRKRHARLPGVRRADIALVRAAQPYRYGKRNIPFHAISILSDFNNTDKHRFIQPILWLPDRVNYEIADNRDCVITSTPTQAPRRVLEVGAEIAYFRARKTGQNPYLDVKYEMVALPAVHKRLSVEEWLAATQMLIAGLLATVSKPPQREFAVLGLPTKFIIKR